MWHYSVPTFFQTARTVKTAEPEKVKGGAPLCEDVICMYYVQSVNDLSHTFVRFHTNNLLCLLSMFIMIEIY